MENITNFFKAKLSYETDPADLKIDLDNGEDLIVVDARSSEAYRQEHIPSSINLHHKLIDHSYTSHLDKEKTYITYCDGIGCNASTKGALKMAELGFKVKELIGGIEWWKKDGFKVEGELITQTEIIGCNCD